MQAGEEQLKAIVESAMDAIVGVDAAQRIALFNAAAEKMFRCIADDALGQPVQRFISTGLAQIGQGSFMLRGRRADGEEFIVDASLTRTLVAGEEWLIAFLRPMHRQTGPMAEIERLNRLYSALSQINQSILLTQSRDDLFRKVCEALVERGGFGMAWIGWHEPETRQIVPVAVWGDDSGYIRQLKIYSDDRPEGRGPSGSAFREGVPYVSNDLFNDPRTLPWRGELMRRGFRSSAAFPIRFGDAVCGTLSVYAAERGFFEEKEVALLTEVSMDVSFALDGLAREEARQQAEARVQDEQRFSLSMIESMPGIVYFYDDQGRFLRWNRNFEVVSGYSAQEIAGMHPLNFFADEDQPLLQERIAEVFEKGESSVEAPFLCKDGRRIPYFFTGKRVVVNGVGCLVGMGIDISERKRAEASLSESEHKYRDLVEHANSVILRWNGDGRITFLNEFGQRLFGYKSEEIIGRDVMDTIVPPTERGGRKLQGLMDQICANPEAFEQNVNENMRRNGERLWIAWTNRIVRDPKTDAVEILSIGTDITQRRQAEEALRASEERYRTTLDTMMEGCQIIGFDWTYIYLNARAAVHNRRPNAELLGRRMPDVWPGIEATPIFALLRRCMEERIAFHEETEFHFPDGGTAWFDVRSQPIPEGIFVLSIDISERKRAETALRELNEDLEHKVAERTEALRTALFRAEAADQIKSAFLATMSHELRTPLNSIIGFTGIVLQGLAGPLTPEQTKQLGMVQGSARHLLDLINDVLDLSKIEAKQLEVRAEKFALPALLERAVASVRPQAEAKGLALSVNVDPALAEMVSDPRRVEQVLLNLLNNAIKFTDRGGVTLAAEMTADFVRSAEAAPAPAVRLRVTDTGIGIQEDELENLFQPFHQIDTGLAREHEGTGLGLAICRRLAMLMGGEIYAASEWGKGSEFTVILPLNNGA